LSWIQHTYRRQCVRAKGLEVTDQATIDSIIKKASICRLSMARDNQPYVVPLCFGYDKKSLYMHSGPGGKKLEIIKTNPEVCFLIDIDHKLVTSDSACDFEFKYRSIIGYGHASFIENVSEKKNALNLIVSNYLNLTYESLRFVQNSGITYLVGFSVF
jgi:nitroimidazol reductase NimA-like FMN-containing flavoprotein (pyridoxamine 5'-phosphate oxidase superfamily)